VLHNSKDDRNVLHTVKMRKANWIGHILYRNCLLKHVTEGTTEGRLEVTGRRCKQLLNELRIRVFNLFIPAVLTENIRKVWDSHKTQLYCIQIGLRFFYWVIGSTTCFGPFI